MAVGSGGADNGNFAEFWDGAQWSALAIPSPGGLSDELASVSCTAKTACMAVGTATTDSSGDTATEAERLIGRRWVAQQAPDRGPFPGLNGVSCTSPSACVAVGSTSFHSGSSGLLERFNGRRWTAQVLSAPRGAQQSSLADIACLPRRGCIAVGQVEVRSRPTQPLVGTYS